MRQIAWIYTCSITITLLAFPVAVQAGLPSGEGPLPASIVRVRSGEDVDPTALLQQMAKVDVVYLGETHDRPEDHRAQLEIIQTLHRLNPRLVIGMGMFQRPFQSALDRYLAGRLDETELQEQTEYKRRWGFTWEFYAPILRFAKRVGLPVVALNAPSEVTRQVARGGLDSLSLEDFRFIPPRSAIRLEPESYRQRLRQIYDDSHQGKGNSASFERFFQAQVLWDETMAEGIATVLRQRPGSLVVVLAGQGHLFYGDGIPVRVARRLPGKQQMTVLLNPLQEIRTAGEGIADYFWVSH